MPPRKKVDVAEPEVVEATDNDGPNWYTRILGPGSTGDDVRIVQGKIGCSLTGIFDKNTEDALAAWLATKGMATIGMVDVDVANALGNAAVKSWWYRRISFRPPFLMEGPDIVYVQERLGLPVTGRYCNETVKRVKGWQTTYGLRPDGDIDQATAERFNSVGT